LLGRALNSRQDQRMSRIPPDSPPGTKHYGLGSCQVAPITNSAIWMHGGGQMARFPDSRIAMRTDRRGTAHDSTGGQHVRRSRRHEPAVNWSATPGGSDIRNRFRSRKTVPDPRPLSAALAELDPAVPLPR